MEFLQVNLGNLLTMITFLIGGLGFVYTIRGDVKATSSRLTAVENELYELRKVVVSIARQEERLNSLDQRMIMQGQRLDQMVPYTYIKREISRASEKESS